MAGTTLAAYMPPEQPLSLASVWNIKKQTTLVNYLEEYKREWPSFITEKRIRELREQHKLMRVPPDIWRWIQPRWQSERIDPKPDAYSLFGGMIEDWEIKKYGKDAPEWRVASEVVEEAGLVIVRELKRPDGTSVLDSEGNPKRISLFRKFCLVYGENKKEGGGKVYEKFDHKTIEGLKNPNQEEGHTYEIHFFHVLEADGILRDTGYPGETRAPEIIPIASLYPLGSQIEGANWFYPKHAFGLKILLRQLIEKGQTEYKESLTHLEKHFTRDGKLGFRECPESIPLPVTDEEAWLRATKGVKRI